MKITKMSDDEDIEAYLTNFEHVMSEDAVSK